MRASRGPRFRPWLAGLALMVLSAGCGEEQASGAEEPSIFAEGADQVMVGVEQYLSRDGIRRGALEADTAYTYEDASRIDLRRLEIRFFDDGGADRGILTANSGNYDLDGGDMTVRGGVVLRGRFEASEPSVLETDSLVYDAGDDELSTEAAWTLTHPDGTIERGRGLVTDPSLENIAAKDWTVTAPDVEVPQ